MGNTGTLKNEVTRTTGKFGGALNFDGNNDYVDVPDSSSLKFGNNGTFTVSAWIYPRAIEDPNYYKSPIFVGKYPTSGNGWRFQSSPSGRLEIEANGRELYGISGKVVENKWQFVTAVQTANQVRLYVDGVDVTDAFTTGNGNYDNTSSLLIGTSLKPSQGSCCQAWFDGIMDDVKIYNRALTASEVLNLYNSTGALAPYSTKFTVGDRVQVSSGPLNVRSTPSLLARILGTQVVGALGTLTGGATAQEGYRWWNINYDSGVDGYSSEDFIAK
jgi:hypothetical protein